jgi:aryl-alcohol dehydrogenase-like predicted oxidoreductase
MSKLILGSAQFGMNYGVSNKIGKIDNQEIKKIFQFSQENSIDTVDTAMSYGNSEELIGIYNNNLKVISKLPPIPKKCNDIKMWFNLEIKHSLERLKLKKLHGILLHKPDDLLGENGLKLSELLNSLKRNGTVSKIGISIYNLSIIDKYLDLIKIDIIQCPFNIIDQRLINSDIGAKIHGQGIEIHARSIFLQGLLLMPSKERPEYFQKWSLLWSKYDKFLNFHNISSIQACIDFILSNELIDKFVVGIDSLQHLNEVVGLTKQSPLKNNYKFNGLSSSDPNLINPSLWSIN